ncbi:MAG TPA: ATP-binding protein [Puia sp.]|jgi:signal transduction histidine kinase|nr:ATP-binding protein [Puia sp.]
MNPQINGDGTRLLNKTATENHFNDNSPEVNNRSEPLEFTYTLAHEIRNPLSTINLAVDMLKLTNDEHEKKTCLDIIVRNSLRINNLLTDLLNSYQLDEIRLKKYSINQVMDEVLVIIGDRLTMKNIKVLKYYSTLDCKILLNKEKIKIALTNIIINAIEAMPLEKGQLKLVTKLINGKCIVEIEDNGSGISKENMKKIFTPYFTSKPEGMGLGLSSSLDILRANHFHVNVESKEGIGTRFILLFDNPVSEDG